MKIEIDTRADSKDELKHLANMLHALVSSRDVEVKSVDRSYDFGHSKVESRTKNIFDDSSPSIMGMFGDVSSGCGSHGSQSESAEMTISQQSGSVQQAMPPQAVADAGLFSLFSSIPGDDIQTQSSQLSQSIGSIQFTQPVQSEQLIREFPRVERKTTAKELLEGNYLTPY